MINVQDAKFGRMGNRFFQLAYIYAQFRDGKIPDIYLQDLNYFDKYRDEIRELFKQDGEPLDYISVHVRRGKNPSNPNEPNYSDNPFYVNLSETDYYQKAMAEFPGEKFLWFSDDAEYLESDFSHENIYHKSELDDFSLMSRCKGHIIANSSFSWFAAYLGGGKTVAPSQWFASGTRINYPTDWIVI